MISLPDWIRSSPLFPVLWSLKTLRLYNCLIGHAVLHLSLYCGHLKRQGISGDCDPLRPPIFLSTYLGSATVTFRTSHVWSALSSFCLRICPPFELDFWQNHCRLIPPSPFTHVCPDEGETSNLGLTPKRTSALEIRSGPGSNHIISSSFANLWIVTTVYILKNINWFKRKIFCPLEVSLNIELCRSFRILFHLHNWV